MVRVGLVGLEGLVVSRSEELALGLLMLGLARRIENNAWNRCKWQEIVTKLGQKTTRN